MSTRKSISGTAKKAPSGATPSAEQYALNQQLILGSVSQRAIEVIGSESEALRWLGTPIRALNYATPISLLGDEAGSAAVLTVLGRLEHGIL